MSFDISIACMIDDKLSKSRESFAEHLMHLIDDRGITDAQAYKRSNIDRRLFFKIKNNEGYTPTKRTICAFAIGLQLSKKEADLILKKAGYSFAGTSDFDIYITIHVV